jgi:hypothetical protein
VTSPFSPTGPNGRPNWGNVVPNSVSWSSVLNGRPSWVPSVPVSQSWSQFPVTVPGFDEVGYGEGGYGQGGYDTPSSVRQGIGQPVWTIEVVK